MEEPDIPPVEIRAIPHPGEYVDATGALVWHCDRCGEIHPLTRRACFNCGEERPPALDPWVRLAERDIQLTASLGVSPTNPLSKQQSTEAFARFVRSTKLSYEQWKNDEGYDVAAIAEMTEDERRKVVGLMMEHDPTWREIQVLDAVGVAEADELLLRATKHHLSASTRLEAAEALHRKGKPVEPIDKTIARELRLLTNVDEALSRALRMATEHPTDAVKQALLYASVCTTHAAPHCAGYLAYLCGKVSSPRDLSLEPIKAGLGLHVSYFTRKAAFEKLCELVGMTLEPD